MLRTQSSILLPSLVLVVLLAAVAGSARAAVIQPDRTVVLHGYDDPISGLRLVHPEAPTIDAHGYTAFQSELYSSTEYIPPSQRRAIWSEVGGPPTMVARLGDPAAGGGAYTSFGNSPYRFAPIAAGGGVVTFQADFAPNRVFQGAPGNVTQAQSPTQSYSMAATKNGKIAALSGSSIVAGQAGAFTTIDSTAQAPGLPPGVTYGTFTKQILINDAADLMFSAGGQDANLNLFRGQASAPSLVAAAGQSAPGMPFPVTFQSFEQYSLSNGDLSAFTARVSNLNGQGLWVNDAAGNLTMAAYRGMAAEQAGPGVTFGFIDAPVINSDGDVAFRARLHGPGISGSEDWSLWTYQDGELKLIVSEGQSVLGYQFNQGSKSSTDFVPILNDDGHLVMSASLLTPLGADAMLAYDIDGNLLTSILGGDQIEVAPGDIRTLGLGGISWKLDIDGGSPYDAGSNGHDGLPSPLNDSGQFAFHAYFTGPNGSSQGVFVMTVPEPSSLLLAAMGTLGMVLVYRRRSRRAMLAQDTN